MSTARLLTVSQYALGRGVFTQGVCGRHPPGPEADTPLCEQNDRYITLPQLRCGR